MTPFLDRLFGRRNRKRAPARVRRRAECRRSQLIERGLRRNLREGTPWRVVYMEAALMFGDRVPRRLLRALSHKSAAEYDATRRFIVSVMGVPL